MAVHPAGLLGDWGFGDFQSLRTSPDEHRIQPIEASQLAFSVAALRMTPNTDAGFARSLPPLASY
jgi:hypothetical protein